jgi:serine/threonine protein phosphatase PrpC
VLSPDARLASAALAFVTVELVWADAATGEETVAALIVAGKAQPAGDAGGSVTWAPAVAAAGCSPFASQAYVVRATLVVANAGDSRAVLADGDGVAVPLSDDHKPGAPGESARIHAAGGFVSCIGGVTRVNGNLSLSRAIGDLQYKQNGALGRHEQVVTAQPDVVVRALAPGDAFLLLACDGVWDVLDRQAAVDVVRERLDAGETAAAAAAALLDACLSPDPRATRGAGCDNMTALVVLLPSRRR